MRDFKEARRVDEDAEDSATLREREAFTINRTGDAAAHSSDEDNQQAKNYQLFVTIRKKYPEKTIIKEIDDILNSGADINAFNKRGKTVVDIARQKGYESLLNHLIGRGGKAPLDVTNHKDDGHQNIVENIADRQQSTTKPASTRADKQREVDSLLLKDGKHHLTEDKLKELNAELNSGLEIQDAIDALMRCRIDLKYVDSKAKASAVDIAWESEYYDALLMLLEAGSQFPKDFRYVKLDTFYGDIDIPEELKALVRERIDLHEWVRDNQFKKILTFVTEHHLSNFFNYNNESALGIAAEFANVDTLASVIGIVLSSRKITISDEQRNLLRQLNPEGNTLLSVAAECGNKDNVDFLIRCGLPINHRHKVKGSAVDLAWCNRHYDVVHALLNVDSHFPEKFHLDAVDVANAKALRQFVEERNNLHKLIEDNRLDEIKEFTATDKSTLYLNCEGQSALFTALKNKRFEIYAFLKSIGVTFKSKHEEEYINKLSLAEKDTLKSAMIREFPQSNKCHILYLMSKSRSKKHVDNFEKRIKNIYKSLDDIPEVSIILQVLQYTDYLDIIFDFDEENIKDVDPTASESCKGVTNYQNNRIFVAAGRDEVKLAGTLAHELCHLAMYILYQNNCNPFYEVGDSRHQFKKITDRIREKLKETKIDQMSGDEEIPVKTLARAFEYPEAEQQSELIVRVPHILAQYSEVGRNALLSCEEFEALYEYYNDEKEEGLMYRCHKMIENNFLMKLRQRIQLLNETLGRIEGVIKYGISFDNAIHHDTFFKNGKQVILLKTESTLLSKLNVYDSLILKNKKYSLQNSFLLDFDAYIKNETEILQLFNSLAGKVLCLSFSSDSRKEQVEKALETIKQQLLDLNPDKKVILIIQDSEKELLDKISNIYNKNYEKLAQHKFTLNDFTKETQLMLLEQDITFQGVRTKLNELIDISDDSAKSAIDTKILVKLIEGERIDIGRKPADTSDLVGAYSEMYQEVDVNTMIDKLLEEISGEVYIISGIQGANKQDKLIHTLISDIEDMNTTTQIKNLKNHMEVLEVQDVGSDITKRLQVAGDQFRVKHFAQICHNNSALKIYWIHWRNESKFMLQRIYNPDFYVAGNRISREVVIEKSIVRELTSAELSEKFFICANKTSDIRTLFRMDREQQAQFEHNMQNNMITLVYLEDGVEDYFPEIVQANQTVHLFKFKKEHLVWYKTYGSLRILIKHRAKDYKNIEPLIEDNDAIKIVKDNKVSIIAGDPGTGKSTFITRLYNTKYVLLPGQQESLINSHWVIKVNLKDQVASIKNMKLHKDDASEITEFLLRANSNISDDSAQTFAQNLLGMILQKKNFVKPLLIVFDGFDEVLDKVNRRKIISLLQYLKDKTYAKICITTRLHYEEYLEGALSTFALKLEPMEGSTINKLITKSFSNLLGLQLSRKEFTHFFDDDGKGMVKYTDAFLDKMRDVFKNDITKFFGTPLQIYLMLKNALNSFLDWMRDDTKTPDFSYLGNDIWEVYETFVANKYDYFAKTKTGEKEDMLHQENIQNLNIYHKDLAKSLIFKSEVKEYLKSIEDIILSVGIVKSEGNHLSFIHPTFAEYFAAKVFLHWIRKWKVVTLTNFTKQEYFFAKILQESDYRVIRAFLNAGLLKENFGIIELNAKYYNNLILCLATKENHVGIAKLVFDNFSNIDVNEVNNSYGRPLNIAAESGYLEMSKLLIEKGADVNALDKSNRTALFPAAQHKNLEIVRLLIEKGAEVNFRNNHKWSVLHIAASTGDLEIIKLLIDNGADVNARGVRKYTSLHIAAMYGYLEMAKLLLEKGADINAKDNNEATAFHKVVRSNRFEIAKFLIEQGTDVNAKWKNDGSTALHDAAELGFTEIVKILIQNGAAVNAKNNQNWTALHLSAKCGHLEIVKFLIEKGAEINIQSESSPLHLAAQFQHSVLDEVLSGLETVLDEGLTVLTRYKGTYINVILSHDSSSSSLWIEETDEASNLTNKLTYLDIATYLIEKCANVNAKDKTGRTALYFAAKNGNLHMVKLLINRGADFNLADNYGTTALHAAAMCKKIDNGTKLVDKARCFNIKFQNPYYFNLVSSEQLNHLKIAKLLIENGAAVNAKDKRNLTALHFAVQSGHLEIVKLLIHKGASVDAKDNRLWTPLYVAANCGRLEIFKLLIEKGAQVKPKGTWDTTALHLSAKCGHLEIVKFLIEKGAEINIQSESPLHLAAQFQHSVLDEVLSGLETVLDEGLTVLTRYKGTYINVILSHDSSSSSLWIEETYEASNLTNKLTYLDIATYLIEKCANVNAKDKTGRTALYFAAKNGNLHMVKLLINRGADFNLADNYGTTALHAAAMCKKIDNGTKLVDKARCFNIKFQNPYYFNLVSSEQLNHLKIAKLLIENGAAVNAKDKRNLTALHFAVQSGHLEIVKLLIHKGASVDAKDNRLWTPLYVAANCGRLEIFKLLIEKGAQVKPKGTWDTTALHLAAKSRYLEIYKLLREKYAAINAIDKVPEQIAYSRKHLKKVKLVMEQGVNVDCPDTFWNIMLNSHNAEFSKSRGDMTVFHLDPEVEYSEIVKLLLEKDANINAKDKLDMTALHIASLCGNLETVKLLTDHGADVNCKGKGGTTALYLAAGLGKTEIVKVLMEKDADLNATDKLDMTALHIACLCGNLEMVKLLTELGAEVGCKGKGGLTALHFAAMSGRLEIIKNLKYELYLNARDESELIDLHLVFASRNLEKIKLFIEQDPQVECKYKTEMKVFDLTSGLGHSEVVKVLIDKDADVNAKDKSDMTALHIASLCGNLETVKLLTDHGADVNFKGKGGTTALHIAARCGNTEIVKYLIEKDADVNAKDKLYMTALHIASLGEHLETVKLLTELGADVHSKDKQGLAQ